MHVVLKHLFSMKKRREVGRSMEQQRSSLNLLKICDLKCIELVENDLASHDVNMLQSLSILPLFSSFHAQVSVGLGVCCSSPAPPPVLASQCLHCVGAGPLEPQPAAHDFTSEMSAYAPEALARSVLPQKFRVFQRERILLLLQGAGWGDQSACQ